MPTENHMHAIKCAKTKTVIISSIRLILSLILIELSW